MSVCSITCRDLAHEPSGHTMKIFCPLVHNLRAGRDHDHPINLVAFEQNLCDGARSNGFAGARGRIDQEMPVLPVINQPLKRLFERHTLPRSKFRGHRLCTFSQVAFGTQSLSVSCRGLTAAGIGDHMVRVKISR